MFDQVKKGTIIQDYYTDKERYELDRVITLPGDNTSIIEFSSYILEKGKKRGIPLNKFNEIFGTEFEKIENKPYEVLVNIDIGQDFFKESRKLLNEEMVLVNTIAEEIEKTKTRIATSEHYATGDIAATWQPRNTNYDIRTINVGTLQDYFVMMPGDRDHQVFEFLQGNVRTKDYEETFKFYDYQIIQMSGLSPATFGYEKDSYMNNANVNLSANASEMTIEAIKRQLEPQINRLIENIIRLQQSANIEVNKLPLEVDWNYGSNERIDDMKKIEVLKEIQRSASIPYKIRAEILTPVINKLIDNKINAEDLLSAYNEENKTQIEFGEI